MPILPLIFDSNLNRTIFQTQYLQELEKLYIDNLNLAYVAFTRAKKELYVFAPKTAKDNKKNNHIGVILHQALINSLNNDDTFQQGQRTINNSTNQLHTLSLRIPFQNINKAQLNIFLPSRNYFITQEDIQRQARINLGNLMHQVLCQIIHWEDLPNVIQQLLTSGQILEQDLNTIYNELQKVRTLTQHTDWFQPHWQVINEQDIILNDGTTRRPDRLLISDNQAVIVDWKFGKHQLPQYTKQVKEYLALLKNMGYQTQGWICYVELELIQKINI